MSTFCQRLYHRKCQRKGGWWSKNVVCKCPFQVYVCRVGKAIAQKDHQLQTGRGCSLYSSTVELSKVKCVTI